MDEEGETILWSEDGEHEKEGERKRQKRDPVEFHIPREEDVANILLDYEVQPDTA